jgi:hypothetical protein
MAKSLPQLGIFWLYRHRIIAFTVPVDAVTEVGGSKDASLAHSDLWDQVVKQQPKLAGKEYWSVPRGRVLFQIPKRTYIIYSSTSLASDQSVIGKIVRRFGLSGLDVQVGSDRHYDPPDDDMFEDE